MTTTTTQRSDAGTGFKSVRVPYLAWNIVLTYGAERDPNLGPIGVGIEPIAEDVPITQAMWSAVPWDSVRVEGRRRLNLELTV